MLPEDLKAALAAPFVQIGAWFGIKNPYEGERNAIIQNIVVVGLLTLLGILTNSSLVYAAAVVVAMVKIKNILKMKGLWFS
jgi:hypothetical protein